QGRAHRRSAATGRPPRAPARRRRRADGPGALPHAAAVALWATRLPDASGPALCRAAAVPAAVPAAAAIWAALSGAAALRATRLRPAALRPAALWPANLRPANLRPALLRPAVRSALLIQG